MKVTIRVKNKIEVSPKLKEHVQEKLHKLEHLIKHNDELEAHVLFKEYDDHKTVEITIPTKNIILRAEVKGETFLTAIDGAIAKLEGQVRRHKSKIYSSLKRREGVSGYYASNDSTDLEGIQAEIMINNLVKNKSIELRPMTIEDALVQMDLLGHKFYIFLNSETSKVCVVYLRDDYDYGIIEANL